MKNTTIAIALVLIIVFAGIFVFLKSAKGSIVGDTIKTEDAGKVQEVVLSIRDFNYYPQEVRVKAGQPVKISLDKSVSGCLRDFTIRDLGIRQYLRTSEDYLEFTPAQKGTFTFACSMGMGYGKLIVE